jgi:Beta-propeller repeat
VINPVLSYSTYLGGSSGDEGDGIAVDGAGNAYVMPGHLPVHRLEELLVQPGRQHARGIFLESDDGRRISSGVSTKSRTLCV